MSVTFFYSVKKGGEVGGIITPPDRHPISHIRSSCTHFNDDVTVCSPLLSNVFPLWSVEGGGGVCLPESWGRRR
jgi:hypothetical protein